MKVEPTVDVKAVTYWQLQFNEYSSDARHYLFYELKKRIFYFLNLMKLLFHELKKRIFISN